MITALRVIIVVAVLSATMPADPLRATPLQQPVSEFFVQSDPGRAGELARRQLLQSPDDPQALFVAMESAALQADSDAVLDYAIRLCATNETGPLATVAAARIRDLSGNNTAFSAVVPRLKALLAARVPQSAILHDALVGAAKAGLPDLSLEAAVRDAGLLTEWTVAGPFGRLAYVDFDKQWPADRDSLSRQAQHGRPAEKVKAADGEFALPKYFGTEGVFYAATTIAVNVAGDYTLRIESPGTLAVKIDGREVLVKDSRLVLLPSVQEATLPLSAGTHRVLVKFIASASPFRASVKPAIAERRSVPVLTDPRLSAYASASERFWTGDMVAARADLARLAVSQPSAAVHFLSARLWQALGRSFESDAALDRAEAVSRGLPAVQYARATSAFERGDLDAAWRILNAIPDVASYPEALSLMARVAIRLGRQAEASSAIESELAINPSCSALARAEEFYTSIAAFENTAAARTGLRHCAPGSLAYAESLARAGQHRESAQAAAAVVSTNPLDRSARDLLVRQSLLAGDRERALNAARELAAIAPNSTLYRSAAEQIAAGAEVVDFATVPRPNPSTNLLQTLRRDGAAFVRQTAERRFFGGPAAILLDDNIVFAREDGSLVRYVHRITRVLNRDGIERYGEVALPAGAELIELRTIKPDGASAEPELHEHKATISMPALAPGDAVDVEYLVTVTDAPQAAATGFTFGSYDAPIVASRFAVVTPVGANRLTAISAAGDVPRMQVRTEANLHIRTWERHDIPQQSREVAAPPDALPSVQTSDALQWDDVRNFHRNVLLGALQSQVEVSQVLNTFSPALSETERARTLYSYVKLKLQSDRLTWPEVTSAETTLARRYGSRTAALIALANASGLRADLLLARTQGRSRPATPSLDAYAYPLVLFHIDGNDIVVDAETDGLAFGALPPTLSRQDALLVPVVHKGTEPLTAAMANADIEPESVATADLFFDTGGNLSAKVRIRMSSWRSVQMRSNLLATPIAQRRQFFDQLAARIFPGATSSGGSVLHEADPEMPLELIFDCRVQGMLTFVDGAAELDQLAPALGLRRMFAAAQERRSPLYIESPLIETAVFRVHLPAGHTARLPVSRNFRSEFGEYTVAFREITANKFEVRRVFRVPVQLVSTERYPAFSRFAADTEDAERQRILVTRERKEQVAAGRH